MLSISLKNANEEKIRLQKELAYIKGSVRAQLENYRLFSPTKPADSVQSLGTELNAESVADILSSIGFDVHQLEALIGDNIELPDFKSK